MELVRLNQSLFNNKKLNQKEIEDNKNGKRPYYYSFQRNNHRICIPLRTNAQSVPEKYKLKLGIYQPNKPNSAIDTTKSLVIDNNTYLKNKSKTNINASTYRFIKAHKQTIERKFNAHMNDYIKSKSNLANTPLTKYSTLQYFHNELNIQNDIDDKIFKNCINELNNNGLSDKYTNLKANIPQYQNTLEKYEILNEFKNLSPYPTRIINSDINNPVLEIKKNEKSFSLTSSNLTENPDSYFKEFLDYDPNLSDKDLEL
ncbi:MULTISPECIES: hypothetical protein [Staphylococcus]|uniref:hypothetical protein n=1 Tax=Staphylococcus TaxID=1279 RepID=UPI0009835A84|nr:hypothetical protein [Staphylococcus aureus]AQR26677.1 hypothetical protein AYM28_15385 [Staphylococcus aureus]AQR53196.1 hypothetical protein AYM37_15385 [Staphylococcus aureus]HCX0021360.1 hypothetical protein [Staphylococcus aureus]